MNIYYSIFFLWLNALFLGYKKNRKKNEHAILTTSYISLFFAIYSHFNDRSKAKSWKIYFNLYENKNKRD